MLNSKRVLMGGGEAAASCLPASGGMMFPPPLAAECSKNPPPQDFLGPKPRRKAAEKLFWERACSCSKIKKYQSEKATLNSMDSKMTSYQNEGDTDSYNSMVDNYNKLLKKAKLDYQTYSNNFDSCNKLVNQYNASN